LPFFRHCALDDHHLGYIKKILKTTLVQVIVGPLRQIFSFVGFAKEGRVGGLVCIGRIKLSQNEDKMLLPKFVPRRT
jgi:hypothetical protein